MKIRQSEQHRNLAVNKMDIASKVKLCLCSVTKEKRNAKIYALMCTLVLFSMLCVVRGDARSDKSKNAQSDAQSNCPHCQSAYREDTRFAAVEYIKDKLLSAMGLTEIPKSPKRIYPPLSQLMGWSDQIDVTTHLRHKGTAGYDESEDEERIKLQSEMFQGEICDTCLKLNETKPVIFKLERNAPEPEYKLITLMLYFNNSQDCNEDVDISIYKLSQTEAEVKYVHARSTQVNFGQIYSFDQQRYMNEMRDNSYRHVRKMNNSWINIDFRDIIINHIKEAPNQLSTNVTMAITAKYNRSRTSACPDLTKNLSLHPVLQFQFSEKTNKRSKRTPKLDCKENSNNTDCCRYPLVIDFDEFKWDFIIAPRTYEAYYCAGECPYLWKQSNPHTHIAQMSQKTKGGPCCSPKKMAAIDMLYFTTKGTILYGKIGGMVVEKCGCS